MVTMCCLMRQKRGLQLERRGSTGLIIMASTGGKLLTSWVVWPLVAPSVAPLG